MKFIGISVENTVRRVNHWLITNYTQWQNPIKFIVICMEMMLAISWLNFISHSGPVPMIFISNRHRSKCIFHWNTKKCMHITMLVNRISTFFCIFPFFVVCWSVYLALVYMTFAVKLIFHFISNCFRFIFHLLMNKFIHKQK